jgi:hypothetical protein
MVKLFGVFV